MSLLSKLLGINIHLLPKVTAQAAESAALNVVLHGIADESPLAKKLLGVAEEVVANPPLTPAAAVTTTGHIIAVLDPQFETQFNAKFEAVATSLAKKISPQITEEELKLLLAEIEPILDSGLESIGIPSQSASASTSAV